ncbi:c-type cytochrome [Paracoccus sp. S-4012]|uniref:c-type cytochrome n=1 Tax=Paracoccus sp. S-4012 TaxID=2665648 RepID=UPI0012B04B87|nr:c-type cytochrome [Paracoccus sp. S-4012]MRX48969.1 c-type cytochrome [Paracoccus sp. S-4012]
MIRLAVPLALAAGLAPAQAQEIDPADLAVMAGPCANCHGPDGRSPGAIPSIAGLPEGEAAAKMLAFRADEDPKATIMPRLMKGYGEAEIRALARWFAEVGQ